MLYITVQSLLRSPNIKQLPANTCVLVCTDLGSKQLHRQVGMGIEVTSENLHGVMVAHWPRMSEMWIRVPL